MSRRQKYILSIILAFGFFSSQGGDLSFAQSGRRAQSPYDTFTDQRLGQEPNGCIKWCYQDRTPCDPDYFKQADGRCAQTDR
jgi:hypothetical protein